MNRNLPKSTKLTNQEAATDSENEPYQHCHASSSWLCAVASAAKYRSSCAIFAQDGSHPAGSQLLPQASRPSGAPCSAAWLLPPLLPAEEVDANNILLRALLDIISRSTHNSAIKSRLPNQMEIPTQSAMSQQQLG